MKTDMTETRRLLDELSELVDKLDGLDPDVKNGESNNREKMRHRAQSGRQFIYAAHLADKVRLAVNDEYHVFRGSGDAI